MYPPKHEEIPAEYLDNRDVNDLSPRESEVARLVTEGLSNKEIALILDISPWTVAAYLKRVFNKLHVNRRSAVAMLVARQRYVGGVAIPSDDNSNNIKNKRSSGRATHSASSLVKVSGS